MIRAQDWAPEFKRWPLCGIDGLTGPLECRMKMDRFQHGGDKPDAPRLFLLSTRVSGLGIRFPALDTVVLYYQFPSPVHPPLCICPLSTSHHFLLPQ